jgi:Tetratricopeptide repeat
MKLCAIVHNSIGRKQMDERQAFRKAEAHFKKAIRWAPRWSVPWYNLGLLYKKEKNWRESLRYNQRAVELNPADEAAWWNLGIAATAQGDWLEARQAWTSYGVDMPPGDGEPVMKLGPVPIRLNPQGGHEIVWCSRIDPARAVIENVPLPESGHRFRDILLHDGAPNGYRMVDGKEFAVFDELEVLVSSEYATFAVTLKVNSLKDLQALVTLVTEHDLGTEDWATIRVLCKACSEDRPSEYPHRELSGLQEPIRLAFAAKSAKELEGILENWTSARSECEILEVKCVLEGKQIGTEAAC